MPAAWSCLSSSLVTGSNFLTRTLWLSASTTSALTTRFSSCSGLGFATSSFSNL